MQFPLRSFAAGFAVVGALLLGCSGESPEALIASARGYLAKGDGKAAIIQLKNALQKNPDAAEARFLLGEALLETENPVLAQVELRKAQDLKYPPERLVPVLARTLLQLGGAKKVIEDYGATSFASAAAMADLKTSLALAHFALRERELGEAALADALRVGPDHVPALILKTRLLAGQRDEAGVKALLDRLAQIAPKDADVWLLKGDVQLQRGDRAAALEAYRQAVALRKDSVPGHAAIISVELADNDLKAAKQQLDALAAVRPGHPQTRFYQAQIAYQQGDLKTANEALQQLLKFRSDNPRVLHLAGAVAFASGALLQAEQHLNQALQAAPGMVGTRRLLAQTYARAGQTDRALRTLDPLLNARPPDAEALSLAGAIRLQRGEDKQAEALLEQALKIDPKNPRSRTVLALAKLDQGEVGMALGELEAVADSDEGSSADMALIGASMRRGDYPAALKAVDRLEKKQPGKPLAALLRGRVLAASGDIAAARRSFDAALSVDPVNFPALAGLASLDVKERQPDAALHRFDKLLERQPDHLQALLALAQLRTDFRKPPAEIAAPLDKAIKAHPDEPAPRLAKVEFLLRQRDFKAAYEAAQQAASSVPESVQLLDALARAQSAAGEHNQAVTTLNKLVALRPGVPQPLLALADAYVAAGNPDLALQSIKRVLAIEPQALLAQQRLIALQLQTGRLNEALATTRVVQAQRPNFAVGYVLEGDVEVFAKDWTRAGAAYRRALDREALGPIAEKLHATLFAAGKSGEADAFAERWTKEHPEDARFVFHLGRLALAKQDYAAAEARFLKVVEMEPANAGGLNNLAWTLFKQDKPGALEHAERARELSPGDPAIMDTLAQILAREKRFDRALELQRKAVALQPQNRALRLTLARMYLDAGEKAQARSELERLGAVGGTNAVAQKEIDELRSRL